MEVGSNVGTCNPLRPLRNINVVGLEIDKELKQIDLKSRQSARLCEGEDRREVMRERPVDQAWED